MQFSNLSPIRPYLEHLPELGNRVYIDPSATVIGKVTLGDDVSVWPGTVIRGDVNHIRIGDKSNIQDLSCLHVTHDGHYTPGGRHLEIGSNVTVGHHAVLHACTIGDFCLVGMGAIIMDDVEIGDHCMIAAGSLLSPGTKADSGKLYRGSPARPVRELSDTEMEMLQYSADHYVRLKDQYLGMDK